MNPNTVGLVADALLFLSALLLLIDLAPHDFLPKARRQKDALKKLREGQNLLFTPPPNTNIQPGSQEMKLAVDPISARIIADLIRNRSLLAQTVSWDRALGVGYATISVPVAQAKLAAFHPLYIAQEPPPGSTIMELIPVGQLEDIERWLRAWRQSSVTVSAAILLTLGFLFQLLSRIFLS